MQKRTLLLFAAVVAAAAWADEVAPTYRVVDGNRVDPITLGGWHAWRAMACERCHGAQQQGLVGPDLTESLKTLSRQDFALTLMNGRPGKGMPGFAGVPAVMNNLGGLYAFLKGRSDGAIKPGHLYPIDGGEGGGRLPEPKP